MMRVFFDARALSLGLVAVWLFSPFFASAAVISRPFEISGWIPYWRAATGTAEALQHITTFTEVNPFGYSVRDDGHLYDTAVLSQEPWVTLKAQAAANNVRFIPTVMWSDASAMHSVLSNREKRASLVHQIADEVIVNEFDGIDIDFEGKLAETKPYFSAFLKELYKAMGKKWVQCTIESRTPLKDRFTTPQTVEYANDFAVINKNCDRVRIMTYDQRNIDLTLNKAADAKGEVYYPVADTVWVEKAMKEAMKIIAKKKLVLGIATYGYEFDATAYADGFTYDLDSTFNPQYALDLASQYNIAPARNAAGEMGFSFIPRGNSLSMNRPASTWPASLISSASLLVAKSGNTNVPFRALSWSDAQAIADKVALARSLGIRGVAVFKIDGGADPNMWNVLK